MVSLGSIQQQQGMSSWRRVENHMAGSYIFIVRTADIIVFPHLCRM